jgi:hypothetical protein
MKLIDRRPALSTGAGALIAGFALFVSACGDGGSTPDAAVALPEAGAEAALDTPFCTSKTALPGVTDLSGTWVVRAEGALRVNAPIVGDMRQRMVLTFLVSIDQQGADVVVDGRYCNRAQLSEPGALTQIQIPEPWAHTETPLYRTGTFAVGAEGFPVLSLPTLSEGMGAHLSSATEALPTSASDPRVYDQDNDGKPGITVVLNGASLSGSLYAVQLQTTSIRAIAVTPERVEGALAFTSQQTVLGSDPDNLAALYAMGTSGADPVLCNSSFVMVKIADRPSIDGGITVDAGASVDGGGSGITCEWVRANETALFP